MQPVAIHGATGNIVGSALCRPHLPIGEPMGLDDALYIRITELKFESRRNAGRWRDGFSTEKLSPKFGQGCKVVFALVKGTMLRASSSLGNDVAELNNWGFLLRQKWGVLLQQ